MGRDIVSLRVVDRAGSRSHGVPKTRRRRPQGGRRRWCTQGATGYLPCVRLRLPPADRVAM